MASNLRASIERFFAPGWGYCYRCRRPWRFAKSHITDYGRGRGCFPLCERCWVALKTPEARLPYYRTLVDNWMGDWAGMGPWARQRPSNDWDAIEAAVREGK